MTTDKKAILFMFLASLLFAVMNIIVKYLQDIPVAQIVFMRSAVMMVMVFTLLRKKKIPALGKRRKLLVARGFFGTLGIALFFYTLHQMPLATAVVVHYLTPIFTVLIAVVLTREKVLPLQWFFFALCFTGVLVVKGFDVRVELVPLIIGVLGTLSAATAYNIISLLKQTEHHLVIMFYFPFVTLPLVTLFIWITGDWVWTSPQNWLLLSTIGFLTYFAQYFLTRAYQTGNVSKVSVISYLGIFYALFFGYFLFEEWYTAIVILGIAMVLIGVLGNIFYRSKQQTKAST
jgi:drug/metabolite transporter (DMT)-like permease